MKKNAVVVGGSRGLGRGAVEALAGQGYDVVALGRGGEALEALRDEVPGVVAVQGDGTDEALAERLLREQRPAVLVIGGGVSPVMASLHELSWDEFEINWRADTRIAFAWLRQALKVPLPPGSHVVVVSSGAAVKGSPASGGYAPAKRAQWFMAEYAANEIEREKLGIRVHTVLPNLNPSTELGRKGIAGYARRAGVSDEEFARRFAPFLTPAIFGAAIAELVANAQKWEQPAYRVTGAGLVAI